MLTMEPLKVSLTKQMKDMSSSVIPWSYWNSNFVILHRNFSVISR